MTIASEITRLQGAKADIKAAIEEKGVTVGDITIDNYACCINDISQGPSISPTVRLLVIAGGGGGGIGTNNARMTGGGGAGGTLLCDTYPINIGASCPIVIGAGGSAGCNGENSSFGGITMYGGGAGGANNGSNGGSGGGGSTGNGNGGVACNQLYGSDGGYSKGCTDTSCTTGGGGGGAGGAGGSGSGGAGVKTGVGGKGIYTDIDGTGKWYAGGGGGITYYYCSAGGGCGSGHCGGGSGAGYGAGKNGVVIVSYKCDGSSGITCATGGTKYNCGGYTIHCFTSAGTFCVVC